MQRSPPQLVLPQPWEGGSPVTPSYRPRIGSSERLPGLLSLGNPVTKLALHRLPRRALARGQLHRALSTSPAMVSGPWGEERPPPCWEHRSWRSEVLRKWPLGSSEPKERERVPSGQERKRPSQARQRAPCPPLPTAWRRGPGSLWERKQQGAGCRSPRPTLCPLHWAKRPPPLPGSHQHPSPSHPTCCRP